MCLSLVCCGGWEAGLRTRFTAAKWFYCVGFTLTAVAVWVLRDYGGDFLAREVSSFGLCQQVLSWLGCLIGFMWLPESALYGYAQFARYASGIFLVLQLVLLVNFVYEINEWLVERDTRWAWVLLVGGAAFCFGGGLALTGISFHYYAPAASCSLNVFFATWNLILGLVLAAVLFIPGRQPTAGLLTSGAVWLYCSYLLYSALASEPVTRCVRGGGLSSGGWVGVVAFFIALAAVIYSTLDAGVSSKDMFGGGSGDKAGSGMGLGVGGSDDSIELPYRPDFYHLVFATAACYLAMLFTNWAVSRSTVAFEIDRGWASTWVKIVSSWACAALYGWTVVAPAVLQNRDFGPPV
ncbi:putative serine incorporator [Tetrabaena socialis]|uniref:Putative serine incorporator n=1 Tax=Tetrabaena socialis TaxID=47790 RepID=A0A2J8AFL3_9CHLO|nr:putative serine incorporator [Tetrabaena socialis]|eukprot:PNH11311.1 putative serine incorporator [Tetrabaena socialis]